MVLTMPLIQITFYTATLGALACLALALANPYRIRWQTRRLLNRVLPAETQQELRQLTQAWGGQLRLSPTQLKLMSLAGLIAAVLAGILLTHLLGRLGFLLGGALAIVGYAAPAQRYRQGFSRVMLARLEREAPLLAGFMYRARGVAGLSVQVSFERFGEAYPATQTARLLQNAPLGTSFTDALLGLEFPADEVSNWLEVVNTLASVHEMGDAGHVLETLRDRIQAREAQYLRTLIKKKSFTAPALTVVLILPGLMAILLGSIILQAVRSLGGGSILP